MAVVVDLVEDAEHVLVTCVCEDYDWKSGERRDGALPFEDRDVAAVGDGVAFDVVRHDQDDEIADGDECDNGGVFERVETAKEG